MSEHAAPLLAASATEVRSPHPAPVQQPAPLPAPPPAGPGPAFTPAVAAGLCILAIGILRRLSLAVPVTRGQVVRALGLARSSAYEQAGRLRTLLEKDSVAAQPAQQADGELTRLRVENEVLRYRVEHPGCFATGGRTVYSDDLRAFVLALAVREGVGERMTQDEFAKACGIPLPTLKPWWRSAAGGVAPAAGSAALGCAPTANDAATPTSAAEPSSTATRAASVQKAPAEATPACPALVAPPDSAPSTAAPAAQPPPTATAGFAACPALVAPPPDSAPSTAAPAAHPPPTGGFALRMLRIVQEWEQWSGSFDAFVRKHLLSLGIRHGKATVAHLLHLAAARKLLRRPPPEPSARGSTFRPPPGVQWSSDGKQLAILVNNERFTVSWQPMLDVGSTATVGSVIRPEEDTAGVIASFAEGVGTTGAPPKALLLDNKAPNKSPALAAALPAGTLVMYGTNGRPQSKATIEGSFGLFAQELGPVAARVDSSSSQSIALTVAEAVTRAYAAGRNRRPRRKDGKTPYELYREADPSPEEIDAAVAKLRAIKERIDTRAQREAARRDPYVRALLENAFSRFGFTDDGDLLASLAALSRPAIESAIAIYAAKQGASSLPVDADVRYFAGIARHCQHELELQLYEVELVSLLEREEQLVTVHLERKAAELASLDTAAHLAAIVRELLITPAPVAHVFWRRRFECIAAPISQHLRAPLRRWLCERVRRFFSATKQLRQRLIDFIIRQFPPEPVGATP